MRLELDEDDLFERLAEQFRFFIMQNFKRCLKNTELSDSTKEQLCADFLAELCGNLDQGEWEYNGKYYRPLVGFIDSKSLQVWDEYTKLIAPYEAYHHHDKLWDEVEDKFDDA